jgi:hypothetical protein
MQSIHSIGNFTVEEMNFSGLIFEDDLKMSVDNEKNGVQENSLWNQLLLGELPKNQISKTYQHILNEEIVSKKDDLESDLKRKVFFHSISEMLPTFSVNDRKSILESTYDILNEYSEQEFFEKISESIPAEMMDAIIEHTQNRDTEISPALVKIMRAMSTMNHQVEKNTNDSKETPSLTGNQMKKLLEREKYEEYVTSSYDEVLHDISVGIDVVHKHKSKSFHVNDYMKSIEIESINKKLIKAIYLIIKTNDEDEVVHDFKEILERLVLDELRMGEYKLLNELYLDFQRLLNCTLTEHREKIIHAIMKLYSEKEFVRILDHDYRLELLSHQREDKHADLVTLIKLSGIVNLKWLFDVYIHKSHSAYLSEVSNLILSFGNSALSQALPLMSTVTSSQVLLILNLFRSSDDAGFQNKLVVLLNNENKDVSWESLKLLVKLEHPAAEQKIKAMLVSGDHEKTLAAIKIMNETEKQLFKTEVIRLLRTFFIHEKHLNRNLLVIKSLGKKLDEETEKELRKILRKKITLSRNKLKLTKQAIQDILSEVI